MARLKSAIIKKARLVNSEPLKLSSKLTPKELMTKKVYMIARHTRGGSDYEYKLASKIKDLVIQLALFLKRKELQGKVFKFIFGHGRLILQLILAIYKIDLQFIVIEAANFDAVVIVCCTGSVMGFIFSWFSAAATLVAPPTVLLTFLVRSLAQQIQCNRDYTKFRENISICLTDKIFQGNLERTLIRTQKRIDNSNKIKLEHLNWNKNPAVKEAAERLGIFENVPSVTDQLTSDTLDPHLNKIFEEVGLNEKLSTKTRIKGKTINFINFVKGMVDGHDKSGLDVIDIEIVQEPVRIQIRD